MPYNIIFKILLILLILGTFGIVGLKPKMHKKFLIYDSEYKIVKKAELPEDEEDMYNEEIQELITKYNKLVDEKVKEKETELMSV